MRILHLTDLFAPSIGGMESHVQALVRERHRRGHEMVVVTLQLRGEPTSELEDTGYRVYRIRGGYSRLSAAWASQDHPYHPPFADPVVSHELRRIIARERPDVIHAHNWMIYSYLAIKGPDSPPVVWMQHDYSLACPKKTALYDDVMGVCDGPALARCVGCASHQYGRAKATAVTLGLRASQTLGHRKIDRIMANSGPVANFANHVVAPDRPIDVVGSFAILDDVDPSTPRPQWLPAGDYILFVGALSAHKGLFDLLAAYEALGAERPPLVLVGTPQRDTPTSWPHGVVVRLSVPHDEVMAAWRHCLFGVVPSRWPEPFGLTALEAAHASKAVVATAGGGLGEIVIHDETGLVVPPGEPAALTGAIARLIAEPRARTRLGARARERSLEYTVTRFTDRVDAICREVLEQHRVA